MSGEDTYSLIIPFKKTAKIQLDIFRVIQQIGDGSIPPFLN